MHPERTGCVVHSGVRGWGRARLASPPEAGPRPSRPTGGAPLPRRTTCLDDRGGMADPDPLTVPLLFAATHGAQSHEARALRRAVAAGAVVRVRRGVFTTAPVWGALDARGRLVVRTRAVVLGSARVVASHGSAVALHDLPAVRQAADRVSVVDPGRTTTKVTPTLRTRPGPLRDEEVVALSGVRVTGLERTAVDVARTAPFADAVMCVDAVLRRLVLPRGHRTGVEVDAELDRHRARLVTAVGEGHGPGQVAARRAIAFASPWAENGGESLVRVVLHELGVPAPELQREFVVASGTARCDFYDPSRLAVFEFDGFAKYADAALRGGRTPAEVVRDEKRREAELLERPDVRTVVRVEYRDVVDPRRLARLLGRAGVPVDPRRVTAAARAARLRFAA